MHGEDPDDWRPTTSRRIATVRKWSSDLVLVSGYDPSAYDYDGDHTRVWCNDFCQLYEQSQLLVGVDPQLPDFARAFTALHRSCELRKAFAMICDVWSDKVRASALDPKYAVHTILLAHNPAWFWLLQHYPR